MLIKSTIVSQLTGLPARRLKYLRESRQGPMGKRVRGQYFYRPDELRGLLPPSEFEKLVTACRC